MSVVGLLVLGAVAGWGGRPEATELQGPAADLVARLLDLSVRGQCTRARELEPHFTWKALQDVRNAVGSLEAYCRLQTEWDSPVVRFEIDREVASGRYPGETWVSYVITYENGGMRQRSVWLKQEGGSWKWHRVENSLPKPGGPTIRRKVISSPAPP